MQLTKINGEYELYLPDHRAAREEWTSEEGWEKRRVNELVDLINSHDTVFYLGTEEGDLTAILAKYTDCDLVFFEPNERVWSCIKAIWEANNLRLPLDFYRGFASNQTTDTDENRIPYIGFDDIEDMMMSDHGFKQLYEKYPDVPQIRLDDYSKRTGFIPDVIVADIEGSEWCMLKGAEEILRKHKPVIVLSVHPVFMWIHYKQEVGEMLQWMKELGYRWECIDYAIHEHHLIFVYDK